MVVNRQTCLYGLDAQHKQVQIISYRSRASKLRLVSYMALKINEFVSLGFNYPIGFYERSVTLERKTALMDVIILLGIYFSIERLQIGIKSKPSLLL